MQPNVCSQMQPECGLSHHMVSVTVLSAACCLYLLQQVPYLLSTSASLSVK